MRYFVILVFCLFIFPLGALEAAGPPICTEDSSGRITNVDAGGSNDFCRLSPSELQITLKYLGLCTSQPSVSSYSTVCTPLFESSVGEELTLASGGSVPLVGSISIPEGTYTHAWILTSNTVKLSILGHFTPDRTGKSGTGPYCWTLSGNSSGGTGAINESTSQSSWLAECGTLADSDPQLTTSTMVAFYDFAGRTGYLNTSSGTNSSGSYEIILIDSAGNESIVALNGSSSNPATQFGGTQTFTTPVVVSPSTTSIDLGFRLENNGGVLFGTVGGDTSHIPRFGVGGFEFRVQTN